MSDFQNNDTVAAIATAPGEGAIAIVRLSGPESLVIADRIFRGGARRPSRCEGGRFLYGCIRSPETDSESAGLVDEVVLLVFRAPHSYTREDVVEIQGHGGRASARRILQAVLAAGARAAEPGEFTRRAFLGGRIDLLQAEAVADLILAKSERAASVALEQLQGRASDDIAALYREILAVAADLEASLDFDEADIAESIQASVAERLRRALSQLDGLLRLAREGRVLRDGALVAIAGRPNVGKSTLLNRLLGHERAIVSDTPGTTRDTIEETLILEGFPIRLVDTAGLRQVDCRIEQEGVGRARSLMKQADLVLYMLDARGLHDDDRLMLEALAESRTVVAINKTDLGCALTATDTRPHVPVLVSLLRDEGVADMRRALLDKLNVHTGADLHALVTERHRAIFQQARNELNDAVRLAEDDGASGHGVLIAQHAREAMTALGRITGQTYTDDVLAEIFKRFCVGK